jgi:hypothetical protein
MRICQSSKWCQLLSAIILLSAKPTIAMWAGLEVVPVGDRSKQSQIGLILEALEVRKLNFLMVRV